MNYALIYSLVNFVILIPIVYFSYRIVKNLSKDGDAASAMFFLKTDSEKTFRHGAILVTTVGLGQILVFLSHSQAEVLEGLGYLLLTVATIGVLYFVRGVFEITVSPSETEERKL